MSVCLQNRVVVTLTSDASGTWGCGAFNSEGEWFQLEWPDKWRDIDIIVKELLHIVVALALGRGVDRQGSEMSM